ncbi:hypothetical protein VNO77_03144 [Canavalia gladiata]|uniref:Uncharacterized protein n=1 Tax=Canavalia gladiata TaxID=3824 RepID=A0AAN9MZ67_CANGL
MVYWCLYENGINGFASGQFREEGALVKTRDDHPSTPACSVFGFKYHLRKWFMAWCKSKHMQLDPSS